MLPYIERVAPDDRFIIPTGPLALFLHEWIELLAGKQAACWKSFPRLYQEEKEMQKRGILAGLLAMTLLLNGCSVGTARENNTQSTSSGQPETEVSE